MTRFRNFVTAVCVASLLGTGLEAARAEWKPGRQMAESMLINLALGTAVEENSDLGFCDTCYLGANISPGNNSFVTIELEQGRKYVFTGAVLEGCDLDIIVEDRGGETLAKDTKRDNIPFVCFTPRDTDTYTIRLKLYSADSSQFCGMVLLQEGGWSLPLQNLGTACQSVLDRCERVASLTPTSLLQEPGEWAVMGNVMREGSTMGYTDIRFGSGRRVIVSGGDSKSRDIDLSAYRDSSSMTRLAEDKDADNYPIVQVDASRSNRYALEVTNARSNGPSVVMTAVLDID